MIARGHNNPAYQEQIGALTALSKCLQACSCNFVGQHSEQDTSGTLQSKHLLSSQADMTSAVLGQRVRVRHARESSMSDGHCTG